MTYLFLALLGFTTGVIADASLDASIRSLQITPLPDPAPKREALFKAGQRLFHDKNLSGNRNISCVHCHSPQGASADGLPLGLGEGAEGMGDRRQQSQGKILDRHTPPLFNLGSGVVQNYFWDARVRKDFRGWWMTPEPALNGPTPVLSEVAKTFDSLLAVQAIFPIANHDEMAGQGSTATNTETWNETMSRVTQNQIVMGLLQEAYPETTSFNIAHVGNAIAEFERHEFVANKTPWDLYLRGQKSAMNPRMVKGAKLFIGKANCLFCHQGPHLTTFGTQNIGVPQLRFEDQGQEDYAFRIAPLRNVGVTAPYMHTGVFTDLRQVIDHYDGAEISFISYVWKHTPPNYREEIRLFSEPSFLVAKAKRLSPMVRRPLNLSSEEKEDLRCFLQVGLTDLNYQRDLRDDIEDCAPVRGAALTHLN